MTQRPTSESVLGLVGQPQCTCPTIDRAINKINALSCSDFVKNNITKELEVIRKNCEALRSWGQDWKDDHLRNLEVYAPEQSERIAIAKAQYQWDKIKGTT